MEINFNKNSDGLVPAVIQDYETRQVLMLGYMNQEALHQTRQTGRVTFYSRSKNRLWTKGEESGNYLTLIDIKPDCDKDALLIRVKPQGIVCHTGSDTCWGEDNENVLGFIGKLEEIIASRRDDPSGSCSYVAALFGKGINKIAQKVGEEAVEVVIEAKDNNKKLFLNECADLLFHYLILLQAKNCNLKEVVRILKLRNQ